MPEEGTQPLCELRAFLYLYEEIVPGIYFIVVYFFIFGWKIKDAR